MATVIHRTTLEIKKSVSAGYYPTATWIRDPDFTAVEDLPKKYWDVIGDTLVEKNQAGKDQADADELAADKAMKESAIKGNVLADPLEGLVVDVAISGLQLTININSVVQDEIVTATADPTDTKFVMVCYLYNTATDVLSIVAYEKTTGIYDDLTDDELMVRCIGEWSVPANGTVLTEV